MFKQLRSLLSLSLFFSFVILLQYATSSAMFAATAKEASLELSLRGNQVGVPASEGSLSLPSERAVRLASLSLSCVSDMEVTDYNLPLSCVSGYVYLNGSPVAGATVTLSAHGDSVTLETADDGSSAAAYFMAALSSEPLEVEPGDEVTMSAEFGGQSKRLTFVAQPGSQQVDVVLPVLPQDGAPVATIRRITPRDVRQGSDSMTFEGSGADRDGSDMIQAYRWALNGELISTQASFTLEANALENFPLGSQTISLQVQDDEGRWSQIAQQSILIRDSEADMGGDDSWTLLIYAVGDNNLDLWMGDYANSDGMLYRLRTAGAQENVQVGILYDGAEVGDSSLYTLTEDGSWSEEAWTEEEARMDEAETLRDFIAWGYERFESDYYALSLVDHASGVVGFGLDESTDASASAFLTPLELRSAIQAATNDGSRKLEVLQYDGHSFGLLEDAAIGRGLAHYIITSPNSSWSIYAYEQYRQLAGSASSPKAYAQAVAQQYAQQVSSYDLPYTISLFDMARFEAVNSAVSSLGDTLLELSQR